MATKYLDHGLYANNAVFTGSISSNILTVSAVASGKISVGARIRAASGGIIIPITVTFLSSGTGGVGTYNIDTTSNGTVTSREMTATNGQPLPIADWGVAQDGDGTAIGAATPSTAEVVFTGIASTGVISVLGQAITFTRETDANTCADNLAAAINASSATAVSPASFVLKKTVRDHLYARGPSSGAPAGTCQIMTRQGSSAHAGLIAITHTLNNVSSPATINFVGGSGGAWGWLFNNQSMWNSIGNSNEYGLWCGWPSYTGSRDPGDVIEIRSGKHLQSQLGQNRAMYMKSMGTRENPVLMRIDNSVVWADGPEPELLIEQYSGGGAAKMLLFSGEDKTYASITAAKYSGYRRGLRFLGTDTSQNNAVITFDMAGSTSFRNVAAEVVGPGYVNIASAGGSFDNTGWTARVFEGCVFKMMQNQNVALIDHSGGGIRNMEFRDCDVDMGAPSSANTVGVLSWLTNNGTSSTLTLDNVRFKNFVIGSRLHPVISALGGMKSVILRNCALGNITVLGPNFLGASTNISQSLAPRQIQNGIASLTQGGKRDFFFDTPRGWQSWISTRSYPTLNARLLDGTTPWSIQMIPTTVQDNINLHAPHESIRIAKVNTLGLNTLVIKVELGVEQSLALTKKDVSLIVEYEDASGVIQTINTYDINAGPLDVSTAAWTNADGSQFTYSDSGTLYFNKKKFQVTTPGTVPDGVEVSAYLRFHTKAVDATKMVFIDPEIILAVA